MAAKQPDQEFVEYIVKSLVNNPDDVVVDRTVDQMGVLVTVKVNPQDMGLLIGRSGSTAKAIRTLARIIGLRNNARVNLRIVEPEGSTHAAARGASEPKGVDEVVGELGI
ncbi:MAG: RNA-binding protein [Candidatus Yanofskybacteria bacterium CG10_big_fil_rev_8_21_14_0_10_36_16]|uniref:RNA-binding protein KhpA n=1 Tax=Candidatus Yanofskybacteria bacterium CG10_big_fil_rev_8_21_14_0_10_36_16 TaxID=1975096 RepID=A0A2J0Q886_9BACT|nr:MAG: RNA-binding protein [Candidatus Yanofskybacteria bacterium CG10_big_fil_rev_8_21_14_0_10_36_16]